jgi:hypothetical protein
MPTKSSSSKSGKKSAKKSASKKSSAKKRATKKGTTSAAPTVSDSFTELIGRALTDKEFRSTLFSNRARATRGYKLTSADREALERVTPDLLENQAERLGNRASLAIMVVVKKKF